VSPAASSAREATALADASPSGQCEARRFSPARAEPLGDDGGGLETPTARPSWFGRTRAAFRKSVWAPVALKLVGLGLAMVALSGVGVASMLSGVNGVPVPLAGMLGADLRTSWLANESVAGPRPSSVASAPVASSVTAPVTAAQASSHGASTRSVGLENHVGAAARPTARASDGTPEGSAATSSAGVTADGKVILNLASIEDLRRLPGVGPRRADAILVLRARLGRFKQLNDLLRVKGIGVRGLKRLMPHVVLDAPKPPA
jgi:competence protein ComEA